MTLDEITPHEEFVKQVEDAGGQLLMPDPEEKRMYHVLILDGKRYEIRYYAYVQLFFRGWYSGMANTCSKM